MQQIDSNFIFSLITLVLACLGTITTVIIYVVNLKGDGRVQSERLKNLNQEIEKQKELRAKDMELLNQELKNQKELHHAQLNAQIKYTDHLTEEGITLKNEQKQFGTSITKLEGKTDLIFNMIKDIKDNIMNEHQNIKAA